MGTPWSKVIAPEVVARVKRNDRITLQARGYFNYDYTKFIQRSGGKSRVISTERAIFEGLITFDYDYSYVGKFFDYIANQEHGFMLALLPLLKDKSSRAARVLQYLSYNHPPNNNTESRNVIDPFFADVLDEIEDYLEQKLKAYVKKKGK